MHYPSRRAGVLAGLLLLAGAPSALAQVVVDQANGTDFAGCGPVGTPCASLGAGIAAAAAGDTVTVEDGTYAEYDLLIDFDLTIEAAPGAIPIIDAGGADRHFVIEGTQANPLSSVALRGLTLQNGDPSNGQGGAINASFVDDLTITDVNFRDNFATDGGAISASGANVTIRGSEFHGNQAARFGGAIYYAAQDNGRLLTIIGSLLEGNHANNDGGAVFKLSGDLQSIENGFLNNSAGGGDVAGDGGAIKSEADTTLVLRSTFANNRVDAFGNGGAIDVSGGMVNDIEIVNSTFFENESASGEGAALQIGGTSTAVIRFSTFKDNSAAGAFGDPATITNHGSAEIRASIIAGSAAFLGSDCDGTGTFTGTFNRIDGACFGIGGELTPVTGLAATPARNGGPTKTLMLAATSNAVDVILYAPFSSPCGTPFDQRRSPRPAPGGAPYCDIGSVEAF